MKQDAGIPARTAVFGSDGQPRLMDDKLSAEVAGYQNAFRTQVKTSTIPIHNKKVQLSNRGVVELSHKYGVSKTRVILPNGAVRDKQKDTKPPDVIVDADYLVFSYEFPSSAGTDLDTRTRMIAPQVLATLGWARATSVFIAGGTDPVMRWGGDNTGTGFESILLDLNVFRAANVGSSVSVYCAAFWYGTRLSGDVSFTVRAFKGGTMSISGFAFVNTGGNQVADFSVVSNVELLTQNSGTDGESVATVVYNVGTGALSVTPS
jgi:hypothetical protein